MTTTTEIARAILRLSAEPDPIKDLLSNAQSAKDALGEATDSLADAAYKAVHDAGDDALQHVLLVVKNNPGSSLHDILSRPDISQALSKPFLAAADTVQGLTKEAWGAGWDVGTTHAQDDLSVWGLGASGEPVDTSSGVLASLLSDIAQNASGAYGRLSGAMQSSEHGKVSQDLQKILDDLSRRAYMSVDVARTRAATEAQLATYQAAQQATGQKITLTWVTHFRPGTCATCARLHGRSIPLGGTFDTSITFHGKPPAPYVDLAGPPRHPNCCCRIVAVVGKAGATTPKSMQQWAKNWWSEQTGTGND